MIESVGSYKSSKSSFQFCCVSRTVVDLQQLWEITDYGGFPRHCLWSMVMYNGGFRADNRMVGYSHVVHMFILTGRDIHAMFWTIARVRASEGSPNRSLPAVGTERSARGRDSRSGPCHWDHVHATAHPVVYVDTGTITSQNHAPALDGGQMEGTIALLFRGSCFEVLSR